MLICFVVCLPTISFSQQLCGLVLDKNSREPLIGATVFDSKNRKGALTDNHGYFCLETTQTEPISFQVSYIGYKTDFYYLTSFQSDSLKLILLEPGISMDEIAVIEKSKSNRSGGEYEVPVKLFSKIPNLAGEPDIMKSLQLTPGVKMGDEGSSVFYVRGGTPDQNLTLLDGVPLYYVNHVGGFLSVFDINTIKKATLYKGYFPAAFGGRLSSVLDVRLKDGDLGKASKEFMIGTLASKFFIEGPLNNKVSGMFSVRRCNIDLLMRPLSAMSSNGKNISAYTFYDLTSKVTWKKDTRNKFSLMFYSGRDKISLKQKETDSYSGAFKNNWGNIAGSANWNHFFNNNWMFLSGIKITSFYRFFDNQETMYNGKEEYRTKGKLISKITDFTPFANLSRSFGSVRLKMGFEPTTHLFTPTAIKSKEDFSNNDTLFVNQLKVTELKGFVDLDWELTKQFSITTGLFSTYWFQTGFFTFDPRIEGSYTLPGATSIKASYSVNHQYIHLLTNNSSGLPVDLWIPSSTTIPPEKSEQFTVALSKQLQAFNITLEAYSKQMEHLIYYKPGYSIFNSLKWEDAVETGGRGYSKGVELLFEKLIGQNTGWLAYTLSKDTREFEQLNHGNPFPFKYGRLHEINLVYSFEIKNNITFSANWIFASGNYITLATQKFPAIDFTTTGPNYFEKSFPEAHYYVSVNNFQTAAYHRLDVGFNFKKQLKKGERNIYLGIYNVYNRQNPYYYYFVQSGGSRKLYQYSLFPIIPSFSYSYKW